LSYLPSGILAVLDTFKSPQEITSNEIFHTLLYRGVCGAMEQKSGLGESGKKSKRSIDLLLFSAAKTGFMVLRLGDRGKLT
jgi:hypothetical protein